MPHLIAIPRTNLHIQERIDKLPSERQVKRHITSTITSTQLHGVDLELWNSILNRKVLADTRVAVQLPM